MCAKMIKDTIHDKSAHIAFKHILYIRAGRYWNQAKPSIEKCSLGNIITFLLNKFPQKRRR